MLESAKSHHAEATAEPASAIVDEQQALMRSVPHHALQKLLPTRTADRIADRRGRQILHYPRALAEQTRVSVSNESLPTRGHDACFKRDRPQNRAPRRTRVT
jgi:hypothetical protein